MSDLISKSAAQAIPPLPKCYREYATSNLDDSYDKGWEDALFSLNALPTIDAVPVVGKWEKISDRNYKCSCCNAWWSVDRDSTMKDFKYCPNCGARMDNE